MTPTTPRDDGGPAYPGEKSMRFGQTNDCNEGMSLRDAFAMAALPKCIVDGLNEDDVALCAYAYADAMIRARKL